MKKLFLMWTCLFLFSSKTSLAIPKCQEVEKVTLKEFVDEKDSDEILETFHKNVSYFSKSNLDEAYCREIDKNIRLRHCVKPNNYLCTKHLISEHVLAYERFRLTHYLLSGISSKRYFGFFDEQSDTREYEKTLRKTIAETTAEINRYALDKDIKVRITDQEIAITFLAEGGALLLTSEFDTVNRIHPTRHIGLDDYRTGLRTYSELVEKLDTRLGTNLQHLTIVLAGHSILLRPMTFKEAITGTAVMYFYEKEITSQKLENKKRQSIMQLPLDRQFVITSLVYNSGILFSDERVDQILSFATGEYLYSKVVSSVGKPKLSIYSPSNALERLQNGQDIPVQLTSWNAVYHILQRYGAWTALKQFSNVFDEQGQFRPN